MGLRFRKRIKICKGLSFNINKDSIGLSVGELKGLITQLILKEEKQHL